MHNMSQQFFITGLPRSRTAWFANLLTWGDSICYHDSPCIVRLKSYLMDDGIRGHSCASNLFAWSTLREWFPDAKWVYIDRDINEVVKSCSKFIDVDKESLWHMASEATKMIESTSALIVDYASVSPIKCYDIAAYLGIDIGPAARVRQLCNMNIQIHPPVLKQRLENLRMSTNVDTEKTAA